MPPATVKPQFIETPTGDRLAVLPATEYERLAALAAAVDEDAADVAAFDAATRAATGKDMLPLDMARRMLAGESPVRVWREFRGMKLKDLAEATGLSSPYLSQIENITRTGTLEAMKAIATALRCTVDDLI